MKPDTEALASQLRVLADKLTIPAKLSLEERLDAIVHLRQASGVLNAMGGVSITDDDVDAEGIAKIREIATQLGRAISLSCVVAQAPQKVEDEALAAMDRAWVALADKIIEFAMEG